MNDVGFISVKNDAYSVKINCYGLSISGHSSSKSAVAMAVLAILVAPSTHNVWSIAGMTRRTTHVGHIVALSAKWVVSAGWPARNSQKSLNWVVVELQSFKAIRTFMIILIHRNGSMQ